MYSNLLYIAAREVQPPYSSVGCGLLGYDGVQFRM
jgi:hypothetical protein